MSRRVAFAGLIALGIGTDPAGGTAHAGWDGRAASPVQATALRGTGGAGRAASPVEPAASEDARSTDPCVAGTGGTGGDANIAVTVDGQARTFRIYVPGPIPAGRSVALVVALHGSKDTGAGMERYTGFSALARRDTFIVAYPNAVDGDWAIHSRGQAGTADVDLVGATLDYAEAHYCVDPTRVFAVGVSNGGGEASRVACGLADRVTAVAIVAGDYRTRPPCKPDRPVSILDIHSTADPIVPYLGVSPTHDGSVPGYLAMWRAADSCALPGTHRRVGRGVVRATWTCADRTSVAQLKLARPGHFWPGSDRFASTLPRTGSATAEIWDFLRRLAPRQS
jgi:polyhydroxybutyrate depolymerase